jgi:ribosomal protein S18 acetylase RimI-like enzyme
VSWFRSSRRRLSGQASDAEDARQKPDEDGAIATSTEPEEDGRPEVPPREELIGRPLADLHELARGHGVPRYRLLRKEELIGALAGDGPAPVSVPEESEVAAPATIVVSEVSSGSVEVLESVQRLIRQLSPSAAAPGATDLDQILSSPVTRLMVARDENGEVVGMLTLVVYRIPSGLCAWIEDVVVDERARRNGAGETLTREAVKLATEAGARTVDLTSRRDRQAAHHMYRKLGFNRRETTVYRYEP